MRTTDDRALTVVIRADASTTIGHGHVMRCLALADRLRDHGRTHDVRFVCREAPGDLRALIAGRGFAVTMLPSAGVDRQADRDATLEAIVQIAEPRALVVDHYELGADWEQAMRPAVQRLLAIDDLARAHDCDLLLDQNAVAGAATRYAGKVPETCAVMLGPYYALLQRDYADARSAARVRSGGIKRILISFGGADRKNLTGRCLAAVLRTAPANVAVDVVLSTGFALVDDVRRQAATRANVSVHEHQPSLARLMAAADIAIGAAGATTWERLCLGLPSFVITLADNQRATAEELDRRGLVRWLGDAPSVTDDAIARAIGDQLASGLDEQWSAACFAEVDGRGAERVAAALTLTNDVELRARRADVADEALILAWANDAGTRRNAFTKETINAETHHRWFTARIVQRENCSFFIMETIDGIAVGQVRFEREAHGWELHYLVAPEFRARGLGRPLLDGALRAFRLERGPTNVYGRVLADNHSSQRIFEALGFASRIDPGGVLVYERAN